MDPVRFVFGVHFHQPVGNFDHVFEQHLRDVYRPLVERLAEHRFLPLTMHLSGPLLEWLEAHDAAYLDLLGRLAAEGQLELLLAGFYEPVLASLPRADRIEQVGWMREAIRRRFGVEATGLWLTERVWEPDLAADLADAGVRYVLVDDRHFLVSGFARERLHAPFWTESGGKRVALFPIDERLRYLVPFQPPVSVAAYLREVRAAGGRLAVLVDDGAQALAAVRREPFDAILMDMQMPVMGGLEATRLIRAHEVAGGAARTPILMLSANALSEHREASRLAGADGHVSKPVTVAGLMTALHAVLQPSGVDAQQVA
jgi:CheY-like chemotaxis protein